MLSKSAVHQTFLYFDSFIWEAGGRGDVFNRRFIFQNVSTRHGEFNRDDLHNIVKSAYSIDIYMIKIVPLLPGCRLSELYIPKNTPPNMIQVQQKT